MHANSLRAWRELKPSSRQYAICEALRERGPMTDRQVCTALGAVDMNYARPYITTLRDEGRVKEVGKVKCETTGKMVRLVKLVERTGHDN